MHGGRVIPLSKPPDVFIILFACTSNCLKTPVLISNKINNMKENKSPGVDGIAPKILKETVEQMCTPLAHVFNMSLQEGIVPLD